MVLSQTSIEQPDCELVEAGPLLSKELLLVEYQTSQDRGERAALYRDRDCFDHYWRAQNWLKLDFESGEPCI